MLKKKICMLGSFGVGKTSLIRQYVSHVYSEDYISTVGVHISKKEIVLPSNGMELSLLIWDLEGQDEITDFTRNYLRGMAGYFLVVDGTRPETLADQAFFKTLNDEYTHIPSILLLNKSDLTDLWKVDKSFIASFQNRGIETIQTSAKTGIGVESSFLKLAEKIVDLTAHDL